MLVFMQFFCPWPKGDFFEPVFARSYKEIYKKCKKENEERKKTLFVLFIFSVRRYTSRAAPLALAASFTAVATALPTRSSKAFGII